MSYINNLFPFLTDGDYIRNVEERKTLDEIYCPISFEKKDVSPQAVEAEKPLKTAMYSFKAYHVYPCDVYVLNEREDVVEKIMNGEYGNNITLNVIEIDYLPIAKRIEVDDNKASVYINGAYMQEDVVTDLFVNSAANGSKTLLELMDEIHIPCSCKGVNIQDWADSVEIEPLKESADFLDGLLDATRKGKRLDAEVKDSGEDFIYSWLDSYFALPEGQDMKNGGREVVPLLIGPTGVFKSATVKELCKKYNYRMVDFRVSFTSRLDYSGLFQMGEVDGQKYSYACPMEELVTCSDGFREYCRKAYDRVSQILTDGYISEEKSSDGVTIEDGKKSYLTDEQKQTLQGLLESYKEYMKTPVLFMDEITRCFSGDTRVRLLDGRIRTMKELYDEFGEDKPFYVYACDSDGNVKFVPAYSRGITRRNAQMVKVTLDNGAEVICTPDHRWMLRDGSYEQAQYFEQGRSLMGTYFGTHKSSGRFASEYETYINPSDMKEYRTFQEVARQYDTLGIYGTLGEDGQCYQAHHKDFDSKNNLPSNIEILPYREHQKIHSSGDGCVSKRLENNEEYKAMQRDCFNKAKESCPDFMERQMKALEKVRATDEYRLKRSGVAKNIFDDEHIENQSKRCYSQWESGQFDNIDRDEALRKNKLEIVTRFVKILTDHGYNITEDNYDRFVDYFTGNHGVYYNVMRLDTIKKNGKTLSDIFNEISERDWNSELLLEIDEYMVRYNKAHYSDTIQSLMDYPMEQRLRDYSDVNFKSAHVQKTLSYLNMLGDVSEEEFEDIRSCRDKSEWQNVLKLINIRKEFGSFERAKEIAKVYNHKVVKVEWLDETMDAYDITVPSYHNFLIDLGDNSGVFVHNCKDAGVEGILVQLLNQKKFNNMTMKGCKFVAATNLNLKTGNTRHDDMMYQLDEMYDVNTDLDVAYSNRFMPLKVLPNDVAGRWFSWADGEKQRKGKTIKNIHPIIREFLDDPSSRQNGESLLYNETPVLDAIDNGLTENEQKSQTFPNYRTWEMLSDYMYTIDDDYEEELKTNKDAVRLYRATIIDGLISSWAGEIFRAFLNKKGYALYTEIKGEPTDDVGDFLDSTLSAGVPALMIGPSSLGKTSRVNAYMKKVEKKTGLKPVLINVNLASMDTVDLMGMPTKVSLVDYVGGNKLSSKGLGVIGKELGDIVKDVSGNDEYGMVDTMTLRAPDKTIKDRFQKALKEGREVILFFDECNRVKNPTIMSAMFEVISDYRFANVSFKAHKDKVKIIAACNMAHSEMGETLDWGEAGDYGNAGSLDPALAARFSIYWKKNYDEKDVKSWVSFMEDQYEEGNIDGTILEYFKSLPTDKAIRVMASVEKRKLEDAESSTRALLQLSKDIKSMRGKAGPNGFKKSLYNGRVIFDDMLVNEFQQLNMNANDMYVDSVDLSNQLHTFVDKVLAQSSVWEPLMVGDKVTLNGREMTAQDLIDTLEALDKKLQELLLRPLTSEDKNTVRVYVDTAISIVDACNRLDNKISDKRQNIFESYVGEEFARDFLPYFNSVFGSADDVDITIDMLEDETLITPFLNKRRALMGSYTTDQMVDAMIELMKEFWSVHARRLPSKNYSMLISGIGNIFPSSDSMAEMLSRSGKEVDGVYAMAEGSGDTWIMSILKSYPGLFTQADIDDIRAKMSGASATSTKSRRTRIL
jgi:MoxR-like ATPase